MLGSVTRSDISGALAILEAARDPEAFAKRIAELKEQADRLHDGLDEQRAMAQQATNDVAEAKRLKAELEITGAELEAARTSFEETTAKKLADLREREDAIEAREKRHAKGAGKMDQELAAREDALAKREYELGELKADIELRTEELQAAEADYQQRMARLKELAA